MENLSTVAYVVSQELVKVSSLLPSNRKRSAIVHSLVNASGLLSPGYSDTRRLQIINPNRASYKDLSVYHSREYLDFILNTANQNVETTEDQSIIEFGLEYDCPSFSGLSEYVQLVAGATITAANALKQTKADISICWDGGRHHAQKSHASGYCYVADCVLAILLLKRSILLPNHFSTPYQARRPRVMYLDLDLHFSDGVSQAFHGPNSSAIPQVLTFSIHHASPGFFPSSPLSGLPSIEDSAFDPFSLSLPLHKGASDSTFARIWPLIERVKDVFEPNYVIVQCGVDGLAGDPCATGNWSLGASEGSLGWCIGRIINNWAGKKLLLGGGGYNSPNAARAWTYLTSIALGRPLLLESEIPDHSAFPLYAPSFTFDVPAGNMQEQNTGEYLTTVETCFEAVIPLIKKKLYTTITELW